MPATPSTLAVSVVFLYFGKIALRRCLDSRLKVSNRPLQSIEAIGAELLPMFVGYTYKKEVHRSLLLFAN